MESEITLGARKYTLVPQRIGRIRKKLDAVMGLLGGGGDAEVTDALYEALEVFIPDLAPRWELAGYANEQDYLLATQPEEDRTEDWSDPYDEAADKSPTPPEIIAAVEAIFEIHGGKRLMRLLKGMVDWEKVKPSISAWIATNVRSDAQNRIRSGLSQTAPSPNGESGSTSSTAPTATPEPSEIEARAEQIAAAAGTPEETPPPESAA